MYLNKKEFRLLVKIANTIAKYENMKELSEELDKLILEKGDK